LNDENILVRETNDVKTISGIIDFGDMSYGPFIFDLAICALYIIIDCCKKESSELKNEIEISGHLIAGYISEVHLNKNEISLLFICIKAGISLSIINSSFDFINLNSNNIYIIEGLNHYIDLLTKLDSLDSDDVYAVWRRMLIKHNLVI
jgi:hydroxylysine kinase